MIRLYVVIILSSALGSSACGGSDDMMNGAPARTEVATTAARLSNSYLENAVKAKFKVDEKLRAADLVVSAAADKNEVTLSGSVQSQELRSKAVDLAKSAHSGITVKDNIDVKPSASGTISADPKRPYA